MHHFYTSLLELGTLILSVQLLAKTMLWLSVLSLAVTFIRRRRQPAELVTTVKVQKNLPGLPALSLVPQGLFLLAMLSINLWLAQPVIPLVHETRSMLTRDIFIAVDSSGSMDTQIIGADGKAQGRRIDAAARAAAFFVSHRQGDRVGLAIFDDNTYMHWPMTDDLRIILQKIQLIGGSTVGGGTNFEGPTGPIQSVIDHWKEYGKADTKVLILISDGDAPLSAERIAELTAEMRALGGKLYLLGVGETWTDPEKSSAERLQPLKQLVAGLGGQIFAVADEQQMLEAVATIDKLEKSTVHTELAETFQDVSFYFGLAACLFFSLFIVSVAFTRERV